MTDTDALEILRLKNLVREREMHTVGLRAEIEQLRNQKEDLERHIEVNKAVIKGLVTERDQLKNLCDQQYRKIERLNAFRRP